MAYNTKHLVEDVEHYRSMIHVENDMIAVLRIKYAQKGLESLKEMIQQTAESCQDNIDDYVERIHNLIERGDENG